MFMPQVLWCKFTEPIDLAMQILVGPSDWREVQGARRNGTGRYYMQNLPASEFGPGVFELGVTAPAWSPAPREHSQRAQPLKREDVIPVYVGQAANIRQRLQKFGQAAALLEPSSRYNGISIFLT